MIAAPFAEYHEPVRAEWLGAVSKHMISPYYMVLMHGASLALLEALGIGGNRQTQQDRLSFVAETHILYEREMSLGDVASIRTTIMNADEKRLHLAHEMYRGEEPQRICLQELLFINVDTTTRRSAAWAPHAWERISDALARHNTLPRPAKTGRAIGIREKASTSFSEEKEAKRLFLTLGHWCVKLPAHD